MIPGDNMLRNILSAGSLVCKIQESFLNCQKGNK